MALKVMTVNGWRVCVRAGIKNRLMYLYASVFVIALSVGAYSPLVPLFAQKLGATYVDLGLIGVAFSIPYVMLPILIGILSDRFGRRFFYLTGISCCAVAAILFNLASNVTHIIAIRFFGGIAYALMWPTVEALISDVTNAEERTKAMGRYGFSWALGFLIGPFIGGLLLEKTSFSNLFTVAHIIGLAAIPTALYALSKPEYELKHTKLQISEMVVARDLLPIYFVIITYSMSLGLIFAIFPAYANSLGITSFQIGILFAIFGIARTITFLHSESMSRIGIRESISLALIIQMTALAAIAHLQGFEYFALLTTLVGTAMGIFSPLTLSTASRIAPKGRVGMAMGLVEAIFGVGVTTGPFIGGIAAESLGPTSPYLILAVTSGLTIIPVTKVKRI